MIIAHATIVNAADAYQVAGDIVDAADAARARSEALRVARKH